MRCLLALLTLIALTGCGAAAEAERLQASERRRIAYEACVSNQANLHAAIERAGNACQSNAQTRAACLRSNHIGVGAVLGCGFVAVISGGALGPACGAGAIAAAASHQNCGPQPDCRDAAVEAATLQERHLTAMPVCTQ